MPCLWALHAAVKTTSYVNTWTCQRTKNMMGKHSAGMYELPPITGLCGVCDWSDDATTRPYMCGEQKLLLSLGYVILLCHVVTECATERALKCYIHTEPDVSAIVWRKGALRFRRNTEGPGLKIVGVAFDAA